MWVSVCGHYDQVLYVYVITPLQVLYPVYKHLALRPTALGLGACKPDIARAGV